MIGNLPDTYKPDPKAAVRGTHWDEALKRGVIEPGQAARRKTKNARTAARKNASPEFRAPASDYDDGGNLIEKKRK